MTMSMSRKPSADCRKYKVARASCHCQGTSGAPELNSPSAVGTLSGIAPAVELAFAIPVGLCGGVLPCTSVRGNALFVCEQRQSQLNRRWHMVFSRRQQFSQLMLCTHRLSSVDVRRRPSPRPRQQALQGLSRVFARSSALTTAHCTLDKQHSTWRSSRCRQTLQAS